MMRYKKYYDKFVEDDILMIIEEFANNGIKVESPDDFAPYDLWIERGRKVKTGEVSTKIDSSKAFPVAIWNNGSRRLDEIGRQIYRRYPMHWCLFSKDQTYNL